MDHFALNTDLNLPIREMEDLGSLRRAIRNLVSKNGGDAAQVARCELIGTELGSNMLRHANEGYMLLQSFAGVAGSGLELLAVDRGPGVAAHPTAAPGLGVGLASVQRLSDQLDLYSLPQRGTVVLSRCYFRKPEQALRFEVGALRLPLFAEQPCGDAWSVRFDRERLHLVLADGLGHGPAAAEAADAAVACFQQSDCEPQSYFTLAHERLRATRGAAVTLARIDLGRNQLSVTGVGNVEGRLWHGGHTQGLSGRAGTIGVNPRLPTLRTSTADWAHDAVLILHSDGLRGHFDPSTLPGLMQRDPALIAATLHREQARGRDDVSVVVVRNAAAGG